MNGIIIIGSTFLFLFLLAFLTKRKFGILGLGLAAGVCLNQLAGSVVTEWLSPFDASFNPLTSANVATIALTILPSLIFTFTGPRHHTVLPFYNLIFSLAYALIATTLLIAPITLGFPVDDPNARNIISLLSSIQLPILAFGILIAIFDISFSSNGKG
jgi:hypothetical protein